MELLQLCVDLAVGGVPELGQLVVELLGDVIAGHGMTVQQAQNGVLEHSHEVSFLSPAAPGGRGTAAQGILADPCGLQQQT